MHLIILGAGTAGATAARDVVARGGSATLIHDHVLPLGGTCLNVGCVPSKYLIRAAEQMHVASHTQFPGISVHGAEVNAGPLLEDMRGVIEGLRHRNYEQPLPELDGLELISGRGQIVDGHTVEVDGRRFQGDAVLIATGSRTDYRGTEHLPPERVLGNETLFAQTSFPDSVLVLGGGYTAMEMSQMLNRMGVKVTQLQRSRHLLSSQPAYLGETLGELVRQEGVDLHCGVQVSTLEATGNGIRATVELNGAVRQFEASRLLVARGRRANTEELFADGLQVEQTERGFLKVNEQLETSLPNVFAAGDVLGTHMLVYTASADAERIVARLYGESVEEPASESVPWVVFTDPQIVGVGWTREEAEDRGIPVEEAELPVNRWPRFSTVREERGFLKLFRNRETDTLVGARGICPQAGDLASELALLHRYKIPLKEVANGFSPYLTLNEGIQRCAAKFGD